MAEAVKQYLDDSGKYDLSEIPQSERQAEALRYFESLSYGQNPSGDPTVFNVNDLLPVMARYWSPGRGSSGYAVRGMIQDLAESSMLRGDRLDFEDSTNREWLNLIKEIAARRMDGSENMTRRAQNLVPIFSPHAGFAQGVFLDILLDDPQFNGFLNEAKDLGSLRSAFSESVTSLLDGGQLIDGQELTSDQKRNLRSTVSNLNHLNADLV